MFYVAGFGETYMLNDPIQLRRGLQQTACAYMDYFEYRCTLLELEERFDESIEVYDFDTWLGELDVYKKGRKKPTTKLSISNAAYNKLRSATDSFDKLISQAKKNCFLMLNNIMVLPPESQIYILGFDTTAPKQDINIFLNSFFEHLEERGIYFEKEELFAEDIDAVDIFQSQNVKFKRFLCVLKAVSESAQSDTIQHSQDGKTPALLE